ncbi:MAG: hypothetical protein PHI34_03205 [Acidobacteriota bacterium]|nr:hypothetical protein [Acidobacteriota bacterium]
MTRARPAVACLLAAVLFCPACRGQDPVGPSRRALAGYVAAVDAFAARADKAADAAAAAAAVASLVADLRPVASAIKSLGAEFPDLGNPADAPPALKPDVAAAEQAGGRLTAAMAKIMVWGYVPAVKEAVAMLAEIETLSK